MIRSYRYKLYPNNAQEQSLYDMLFAACCLYNHALAHRRKRWKESRRSTTYAMQSKLLTEWRNETPEENPLALLPSSAAQRTLRRLDRAYREFMKGKRGYPRFKAARYWRSIQFTYGNGAAVRDGKVHVHNAGEIKAKWYREIPEGIIKALTILRKPSGWYVILQMQLPDPEPEAAVGPPIGIDVGLKHALALSNGQVFDAPQFLRRSLAELRRMQRSLARKKKGGRNRRKQARKVARLHERISGQRRLWWHEVTRQLIERYGLIALEDLNLNFMLRNGHLSQAAHDTGLGLFYQLLGYKAIEAGIEIARVPAHNTSQACSGCGSIVKKELSQRTHICPDCGLVLDRDVNAAKNILQRAQHCPAGANAAAGKQRTRSRRTRATTGASDA